MKQEKMVRKVVEGRKDVEQIRDPHLEGGFEKIEKDHQYLRQCLKEVLEEIGHGGLTEYLELEKKPSRLRPGMGREVVQLLSLDFQLLNLVEENTANQTNRKRMNQHGSNAVSGSWPGYLKRLEGQFEKTSQLLDGMRATEVDIVLTAHPTESKKWSILDQHRELFLCLFQLENNLYTGFEREIIRDEIKGILERLWRTGEIPMEKPDISAERRNILYYLREKLPQAVRLHDQWLMQHLEEFGVSREEMLRTNSMPGIRFGTWVGGDRDGHPFVTAEVTGEALKELHHNAIALMHESLQRLAIRLPLSALAQSQGKKLSTRLAEMRKEPVSQIIPPELQEEPWKEFVWHMIQRLPSAEVTRGKISGHYRRASDLARDLQILEDSLMTLKADRLACNEIFPVKRTLQVFGFHLAKLDIRQNSAFHEKALTQLMQAAAIPEAHSFTQWPEERKVKFLNEELQSPRPFVIHTNTLPTEARETLDCYKVIHRHIRQNGRAGIGSLIVSMTRSLSDLLIVYVLCRESGLAVMSKKGMICLLPVVPLFETRDDLDRSGEIMEAFLSHTVTKNSLPILDRALDDHVDNFESLPRRTPTASGHTIQQVMLGYSDSNKDCGMMASLRMIREAQENLIHTGSRRKVDIQFFHGRGGTISRGAGPTHRFLESLPTGSLNGGIRITEQGESIAQKYNNHFTAAHNLELFTAGTFGYRFLNSNSLDPNWKPIVDFLSEKSQQTYQDLISHTGFEDFFMQATPIDVLQKSRIGSRPTARTGKKSVKDMRAIPWVFSWNQARFYLPGWYGSGTALLRLMEESPDEFQHLADKFETQPFLRYLIFNLEASLESAEPDIMRSYASLVKNTSIREEIAGIILKEYNQTQKMLSRLLRQPMEVRRPRFFRTLHARDAGLRLLHQHQVELLETWRKSEDENLLTELLILVNAIASGQRTTG